MKIRITKDIEDPRENRTKVWKKNTVVGVTPELAAELIKRKVAKYEKNSGAPVEPINSIEQLEKVLQDGSNNTTADE